MSTLIKIEKWLIAMRIIPEDMMQHATIWSYTAPVCMSFAAIFLFVSIGCAVAGDVLFEIFFRYLSIALMVIGTLDFVTFVVRCETTQREEHSVLFFLRKVKK